MGSDLHVLERDTMGRQRRVCPTCGARRFPGKGFRPDWDECFWCRQTRAGVRTCTKCGFEQDLEAFPRSSKFKGGRDSTCKRCRRAYLAAWTAANRYKVRGYQRKFQSGVTPEEYDAAVAATPQCPICDRPFTRTPHADHDHATGKFRGVLCGPCNSALGLLGDDVARLRAAIAYLGGDSDRSA